MLRGWKLVARWSALLEDAFYEQAQFDDRAGRYARWFHRRNQRSHECSAQDEFGEERLIETVRGCVGLPPAETIACIMRRPTSFAAGAKQNDDMTLVVLCAQPGNAN